MIKRVKSARQPPEQSGVVPQVSHWGWYERGKPIIDRVLALIGLILAFPLLVAIAVVIRLDSPGPIIFRQRRVGKNGDEFTMYKFRTMVTRADDSLHRAAVQRFFQARSLSEAGLTTFKLQHDPRITRIGRVLRATSLDEVLQLVNVLKGEMSLVGPRPPIAYETEMYQSHHWRRMAVQPGITGVWQVYGRSRVSFEEMVAMDLDYIAHRSLFLDLKLILLTFGVVVNRKGGG